MKLQDSVRKIKGIGEKTEEKLSRLSIDTVKDLLFHFPYRYEDYTQLVDIATLQEEQKVTIKGQVEIIKNKRSRKKSMMITEAVVADDTGQIRVVWFSQPYVKKKLDIGEKVFLSGEVRQDRFGLQIVNPKFEKEEKDDKEYTNRINPVYSLTQDLSEKRLIKSIRKILNLADDIEDWVPEKIKKEAKLIDLSEAIRLAHFPKKTEDIQKSQKRLKFNELFILQLRGEIKRQKVKSQQAKSVEFKEKETKEFVDSLPFELTNDQRKTSWQILQDLTKEEPMNRMLEGDVGAGKTVVAAIALYNACLSGYQCALMAPTEILARQHFESLQEYLNDLKIGLYTRTNNEIYNEDLTEDSKTGREEEMLHKIQDGEIDVVVGTHALITDKTKFDDLVFTIVDEQHRFGVEQRKKLKDKSGDNETVPHFLSMTATPIPRSFALTLYGDLDLSIIKEMPPGRKPVKTRVVEAKNRPRAYDFIQEKIESGGQAFVICPLVEESEKMADKKSVEQEFEKLSEEIFPSLDIGKLHGQMKAEDKDKVMRYFSKGRLDILISTSVVEVGVDVPNANVMMIEDAERFGLAQLHQFRGRVGRSDEQSYCFLFTESNSKKAKERLSFFENHNNGFDVAEYDLELRGPGEVYGKRQSGVVKFNMASMHDKELIQLSRKFARGINFENYSKLYKKVQDWEQEVHLE